MIRGNRLLYVSVAVGASAALLLSGCAPQTEAPAADADADGTSVTVSIEPLAARDGESGWRVEAWSLLGAEPRSLGEGTVGADHTVSIERQNTAAPLFVRAIDGASTVALTAVVPSGTELAEVVLNERTTVATSYALAQFYPYQSRNGVETGGAAGLTVPNGDELGLTNAVMMAQNLADPQTGAYGEVLTSAPNGNETPALATFTSLVNVLEECLRDAQVCTSLSRVVEGFAGSEITGTDALFAAIARDPGPAAAELFGIAQAANSEQPGLTDAPASWALMLRFDGDGESMAGPGNFAIDDVGNIWVNNNYEFNADPRTGVCGSDELFKFGPDGALLGTYTGGGLSGSGFGIRFDPTGRLWLSNFGFAAPVPGCAEADQPPHNSMSLFSVAGEPLSPETGFTEGELNWPQGIEVSQDGTVWIANCNTSTVSMYPQGDPEKAVNLGDVGVEEPFHVVDNGTAVFVSGNLSDTVAMLNPATGEPMPGSPLTEGFTDPMGLAVDLEGNVWVANSGGISLPCPDRAEQGDAPASLVMISPDGSTVSPKFDGGGLTLPWGLAIDGDGNVWAANFNDKRVSRFCGADAETCPRGLDTGDPISPEGTGYAFDGLTRGTGITVDTAGNVWITNNWIDVPVQTNPGGHQIVAMVGAAPPVAAPVFTEPAE